MRYFLHFCYNGAKYVGYQIQPNGRSVQSVIENALSCLLKQSIAITGCGRTDAGVHAKDYYAHFDIEDTLSKEDIEQLVFKLNRFVEQDILIYNIYKVRDDAHARFDAKARTYKYYVSIIKQPFKSNLSYNVGRELNVSKMNEAASKLFDYKDFTSFSKLHTQVNNNNCDIYEAFWQKEEDLLVFTIKANRFLRNMVRAITGTLLGVGLGKISVDDFSDIIEAKDRNRAGVSVPAKALFLWRIDYPEDIFEK